MRAIYLDNAATSFPKPPAVGEAMLRYMREVGASMNRGDYAAAQDTGMTALALREGLCRLFRHPDPACCVLTPGNTWGLNMVIRGWLRSGDHCLVSAVEHNAVMRPLLDLADRGVSLDRVPCGGDGRLDPAAVERLIRPNTRLLVMAHGSNVSGAVQDAMAVGAVCRARGVPFVLDAAQTAGHWPVDFTAMGLSALSVPGHKGLMGPSGIGALLLEPGFARALRPTVAGGTGSASDLETQPEYLPDKFEPGTPNLPGIYGLKAAVDFLLDTGVETLQARETALTVRFLTGLRSVPGVRLAGPWEVRDRVGVISLDFLTVDNALAADRLEREYGVLTRCGLHCAPAAHRTLGTFPRGTVRFSPGWYTTEDDIDTALQAVSEIAGG